tara:strand:- start:5669 stop:6583 length:915 start_codon:yes stop_codon:yes gene_type:complete
MIISFHYGQKEDAIIIDPEQFDIYQFRLIMDPQAETNIWPVLLTYDYGRKVANISFEISSKGIPQVLMMWVPEELTYSNLEIIDESDNKLVNGSDYIVQVKNRKGYTVVDADSFKKSLKNHNVLIEFTGELLPSATFDIQFEVGKAQTDKGKFLKILWGEYSCNPWRNCVSSYYDRYDRYDYALEEKSGFSVSRKFEEGKSVNPNYEQVNIHLGASKFQMKDKEDFSNLKFFFLTLAITILVEGFLISIIYKPDFWERNKALFKNYMKLPIKKLREIVKEDDLKVKDTDKVELAEEIIRAKEKK